MLNFLLFTCLLFVGVGLRPTIINLISSSEHRRIISKIYIMNLIALYFTFIFSDSFYITSYLGWIASVMILDGYINS
jgi:hypothetical protein